jgi:hypothetical protein
MSASLASISEREGSEVNETSSTSPKQVIQLVMDEVDIIELMRILLDNDSDGALAFMRRHLKGKARELLEGG